MSRLGIGAHPGTGKGTAMALICGICGAWAEVLPSVWISEWLRLQEHAWDDHGIPPTVVQQARQIGWNWILPDGRIWLRKIVPG